jgi:hypothetical protein
MLTRNEVSIYSVHDWHNVMKAARRKHPYHIEQLEHQNFYDLKQLSGEMLPNRAINEDGATVNWLNIRWIRCMKSTPTQLMYKTDFDQPEFCVLQQNRPRKRGRIAKQQNTRVDLSQAYATKFKISAAKRTDLIGLCASGVIPAEFHQFYENIPATKKVKIGSQNLPWMRMMKMTI